MKIRWSLSEMLRRTGYDIRCPFTRDVLIGKEVYINGCNSVGHITELDVLNDMVYAEIDANEINKYVVDSKGLNMCMFEIVKE